MSQIQIKESSQMYRNKSNLVFGFHGCDASVCDGLVLGAITKLKYSENNYDWLGKGMYFWENDYDRALEWAKKLQENAQNENQKVSKPAVLGAVIRLGHCLDFLEQDNLRKLQEHYRQIEQDFAERDVRLPSNKGGKDLYRRELDCFLINSFVAKQLEIDPNNAYDTVRGVFFEGNELYPNAGFREKDHIQIAVINPNCIKAFFKVRMEDANFKSI